MGIQCIKQLQDGFDITLTDGVKVVLRPQEEYPG